MKRPFIYGITGKIGVGKSTVCHIFRKFKAEHINADKIVHQLYKHHNKGWEIIKKAFGNQFFNKNQTVNRKLLGEYLWNNPQKLKIINQKIHPLVFKQIKKQLKQSKKKLIVIEAISFADPKLKKLINKILLIKCPFSLVKKRNKKYSLSLFKKIFDQQKIPLTDMVILNNKDKKNLEQQIKKILI